MKINLSKQSHAIVSGDTVSVIMVRTIRAGCASQFWQIEERSLAEVAKIPGFLTVNHFPTTAQGAAEYITIVQFEKIENLAQWESSAVRQQLLEELDDLVEGTVRRKRVIGLESMFSLQAQVGPPRYKMAILLILVIYTMIVLMHPLVESLLAGVPSLVQTFVLVSAQVLLMTYLVMPFLIRRLTGWLHRD